MTFTLQILGLEGLLGIFVIGIGWLILVRTRWFCQTRETVLILGLLGLAVMVTPLETDLTVYQGGF